MKAILLLAVLLGVVTAQAVDLKDLTPWEAARWKLVKDDPKLAPSFLATRDYVHLCRRIVDGKASPENLQRPKEFDTRFLENGDVAVINKAVDLSLDVLTDKLVRESHSATASALDPKGMTPWETARWAEFKDDRAAKEIFLSTRGYVHLAKRVVEGKTPSSELKRPKAYDTKYLAEGDEAIISKAIDKGLDDLAKP